MPEMERLPSVCRHIAYKYMRPSKRLRMSQVTGKPYPYRHRCIANSVASIILGKMRAARSYVYDREVEKGFGSGLTQQCEGPPKALCCTPFGYS